jgi:hypothetical protein
VVRFLDSTQGGTDSAGHWRPELVLYGPDSFPYSLYWSVELDWYLSTTVHPTKGAGIGCLTECGGLIYIRNPMRSPNRVYRGGLLAKWEYDLSFYAQIVPPDMILSRDWCKGTEWQLPLLKCPTELLLQSAEIATLIGYGAPAPLLPAALELGVGIVDYHPLPNSPVMVVDGRVWDTTPPAPLQRAESNARPVYTAEELSTYQGTLLEDAQAQKGKGKGVQTTADVEPTLDVEMPEAYKDWPEEATEELPDEEATEEMQDEEATARAIQTAKDDAEMKEWIKAELPKDDTKDDEEPNPGA